MAKKKNAEIKFEVKSEVKPKVKPEVKKDKSDNLVLFHILVDRKKDVMVPAGTTVDKMLEQLVAEGYDVKDANISLVTWNKEAEEIDPKKHMLEYGDVIRLETDTIDLSNTNAEADSLLSGAFEDDVDEDEEEEDEDEEEEEEEEDDEEEAKVGIKLCKICPSRKRCQCSSSSDDQDVLLGMFRDILYKRGMKSGSLNIRIVNGKTSFSMDQLD